MMFRKSFLLVTAVAFIAMPALAATSASVKDMNNETPVALQGTVENFDSQHSFMLRDASGTVEVNLSTMKSIVLTNGEKVTVNGTVDRGMLGTSVDATNVTEDKGLGQRVGEAIDSVTGQDAAGSAQAVTIRSLPDKGIVKIDGTVDSVDSEKKFTLRDSTGHIDVSIKSSESASLNKGAQVTVIGSVDKGLLGKTINATEVDIR